MSLIDCFKLARLSDRDLLLLILKELRVMSAQLSANFLALQAQVTQSTTVEGSAITLIQGIAAQLAAAIAADNNGDTAALPALQQQLAASATALSTAVTANTPAAGTGTTPPGGTTPTAPVIFTQPVATSAVSGTTTSFTVVATGTAPLTYQWSESGTPISGATSATLVTQPVTSTDNNAPFTVVVTNAQGSVTSEAAVLTVTPAVVPAVTAAKVGP